MKTSILGIVAAVGLLVPATLALPHDGQSHKHAKPERKRDTVTVTARNAIVWVDQNGQVVSTEYAGVLPYGTTWSTTSTMPSSSTSTSGSFTANPIPASTSTSSSWSSSASSTAWPSATPLVDNTDPRYGSGQNGVGGGSNQGQQWPSNGYGYGIAYDLIGPNSACKTADQIAADFGFLKTQGYSKVRTYDVGCDLSVATAAAQANGLTIMLGLNTINNLQADLAKLIGYVKGNWGPVDTINIGNELVNNGAATAAQVNAAVTTARGVLQAAGYTGKVVTVDTFIAVKNNPEICASSDFCAVNAHAFFDSSATAPNAGTWVLQNIASISAATGKPVIVTESGWPYQGMPNGNAVPSVENQILAVASIKAAFASNPGGVYLFQAYDATYKSPGPFGVEQYFGIYGH